MGSWNMMAMRQRMMADQKETDARLQPLIDKMNAAKGSAKGDAMAAVVTKLGTGRRARRPRTRERL
jgi:hypothetical protein